MLKANKALRPVGQPAALTPRALAGLCRRAFLVCAITLGPANAGAFEVLDLKMTSRSDRDAYQVDVHALLDAPPVAVRHVLLNNCEYLDKNSFISECLLFNVDGKTAWGYMVFNPPVLDPRDYISRRVLTKDLAPDGSGVMRMEFIQDHERGPPSRQGYIRVVVNEGHYELQPHDGGKRTRVLYSLTIAPGGSVPLWMARLAARRATPIALQRIEKNAILVDKKGGPPAPEPDTPWRRVRLTPLPQPQMRAP